MEIVVRMVFGLRRGKWNKKGKKMGKVEVCELCLKRRCSGRLYALPKSYSWQRAICENETFLKDGKRYFKYVRGMGESWDVEVIEIEDRRKNGTGTSNKTSR